jgi:hypothetical protein
MNPIQYDTTIEVHSVKLGNLMVFTATMLHNLVQIMPYFDGNA